MRRWRTRDPHLRVRGARRVRVRCELGAGPAALCGGLGAPRASDGRAHPPEFRGRSGIWRWDRGQGGVRGAGFAFSVARRSSTGRPPPSGCRAASPLSTAVHSFGVGGGPRSTRCARSFPQVGICRGMRGPDRCGTGPHGRVVGNHTGVSSPRVWTAPVDNPVDTLSSSGFGGGVVIWRWRVRGRVLTSRRGRRDARSGRLAGWRCRSRSGAGTC